MILDSEKQRKLLTSFINSTKFSGTINELELMIKDTKDLLKSVIEAEITKDV